MKTLSYLFALLSAARFELVNFVTGETHLLVIDTLSARPDYESMMRRTYHKALYIRCIQEAETRKANGLRELEFPGFVYIALLPLCRPSPEPPSQVASTVCALIVRQHRQEPLHGVWFLSEFIQWRNRRCKPCTP